MATAKNLSLNYYSPSIETGRVTTIWQTASPVQYWALAFETVSYRHADAAALFVASFALTNTELHHRIREKGGAYGGGAYAQSSGGVFTCTSYRDPRLLETPDDFRAGIESLGSQFISEKDHYEAILSSIQAIDTPSSPTTEGYQRFIADVQHRGITEQQLFRQQVRNSYQTGHSKRRPTLPH